MRECMYIGACITLTHARTHTHTHTHTHNAITERKLTTKDPSYSAHIVNSNLLVPVQIIFELQTSDAMDQNVPKAQSFNGDPAKECPDQSCPMPLRERARTRLTPRHQPVTCHVHEGGVCTVGDVIRSLKSSVSPSSPGAPAVEEE